MAKESPPLDVRLLFGDALDMQEKHGTRTTEGNDGFFERIYFI